MPNLPDGNITAEDRALMSHFPPDELVPSAFDLVQRFLVYPQRERLKATDAMKHPWVSNNKPLLLPPCGKDLISDAIIEVEGKTLAHYIRAFMESKS